MKTKKVLLKDLKIDDTIRTPLLPTGAVNRIVSFKKIFVEVEKMTLEQAILNFQQDINPEREIAIWEYMASVYKEFLKGFPKLTIKEKKEAFSLLLRMSMGIEDLSIKHLTKEQLQYLKNSYFHYD